MAVVRAKIQTVEEIIDWFGRPWLASVRYEPPIMAGIAGSARTDWAEITKAGFVCCATSTPGRVVVVCKPLAHRQTGAALLWRNSAEWSCWKALGKQRPTIPARRRASRK